MKRLVVAALLGLASTSAQARPSPDHAAGPLAVLNTIDKCWERRDVECIASNVTEDLVYTNVMGSQWRSKDDARKGWEALIKTPFAADAVMDEHQVRSLGPGAVAVVESGWIKGVKSPDGKELPPIKTFATFVLVKRQGRWLVAIGHTSAAPPPPH